MGLAKPKFEKLLSVAQADSVKNETEVVEALKYLGYYYMSKDYYSKSRDYYNRLINLNPSSNDNKISGYSGIGLIELRLAGAEKVNEARLPFLSRSADAYEKILAIDPNNATAKNQINYIANLKHQLRKYQSERNKRRCQRCCYKTATCLCIIRVKGTAAE
jgi:tetratricopeptide (TPR) repeat protein